MLNKEIWYTSATPQFLRGRQQRLFDSSKSARLQIQLTLFGCGNHQAILVSPEGSGKSPTGGLIMPGIIPRMRGVHDAIRVLIKL